MSRAAKLAPICLLIVFALSFSSSSPAQQMPMSDMQSSGSGMQMKMYKSATVRGETDGHPGHDHAAVLCHGGALFLLRVNGGYDSCTDRADAVADVLNRSLKMASHESCYFELKNFGGSAEIVHQMSGMHPDTIMRIFPGDVAGYRNRVNGDPENGISANELCKEGMCKDAWEINAEHVAKWWIGVLGDHFLMMAKNQPPRYTIHTMTGKSLNRLYQTAREMAAEEGMSEIPMGTWSRAVGALPAEDRKNILSISQVIPKDFDPRAIPIRVGY